jgi:hypothetical protein
MLRRLKLLSTGMSNRRRQNIELLENKGGAEILDSLMESRLVSTAPPNKPAMRIKTHIRIVNLVDVNTVTESFKVHLVVFHEWDAPATESRLALQEGSDRMHIAWKPKWHPSFDIAGAMEFSSRSEFYSIKVHDWFRVHWRCDIKVVITASMDLEEFPFDIEDLTVTYRLRHCTLDALIVPFHDEIIEESNTSSEIRHTSPKCRDNKFISHGGFASRRADALGPILDITSHRKETTSQNPAYLPLVDLTSANVSLPDYVLYKADPYCWTIEKLDYFGRKCSTVSVQLNFERSNLYFILNVGIIEFSLVCIMLGAWALLIDNGGRLTFDLIVFLTSITFRGMVSENDCNTCNSFQDITGATH